MEQTLQQVSRTTTALHHALYRIFIAFNIDYLLAFFMLLLAAAIGIAPRDPLMMYVRIYSDYSPNIIQFVLVCFAALMWRFAPSRSPANTLLALPLLFMFGLGVQYLHSGQATLTTIGVPYVSIAMTWIAAIVVAVMGLRNFVFAVLYEQVVECETERQRIVAAAPQETGVTSGPAAP